MSFNAFELVPVIDRVQLMGDKPRTTVRLDSFIVLNTIMFEISKICHALCTNSDIFFCN